MNIVKAYGKDIKINKKYQIYEVNCGEKNPKIEIQFLNEPDKNIYVINNEDKKEIKECSFKNISLECEMSEFCYENNKIKDVINYKIVIKDICGVEKESFILKVNINNIGIMLIVILGCIIAFITSYFIYKTLYKKRKIKIEEINEDFLSNDL